ncbi:MAG TPA: tRNA 2-thiouridine(34) synthase MnmA [Candidatus Limnocylindria bacterium]|nr:tRNA 2-thiouridine(34) synthase MnmA [Candidatus Limnocylindria bacterium]
MRRERIVVAMSGGVDSAVAAARCAAAGYDVIGVSLRLGRDGTGSCCSLDDFHDAAAVADHLGIPHYVFDYRELFASTVVDPFVAEYLAGRTPNPCVRCNQHVKFDHLWRQAKELGASRLATGHYARVALHPGSGRPMLRAARDAAKDQSYFLFMLGGDALARTLFPVGDATKQEVRLEAARLGLPVAEKPESMEVCFVPAGDTAAFVERLAPPEALRPGSVIDEDGTVVGSHRGVHRFTIGQRRGLGLGGGRARYVRALDAATGTVHVSGAASLGAAGFVVDEVHWAHGRPPDSGADLRVRLRHRHAPVPCRVVGWDGRRAEVAFEVPTPVAPGQAAVFYEGEYVHGGGWIVGERP